MICQSPDCYLCTSYQSGSFYNHKQQTQNKMSPECTIPTLVSVSESHFEAICPMGPYGEEWCSLWKRFNIHTWISISLTFVITLKFCPHRTLVSLEEIDIGTAFDLLSWMNRVYWSKGKWIRITLLFFPQLCIHQLCRAYSGTQCNLCSYLLNVIKHDYIPTYC